MLRSIVLRFSDYEVDDSIKEHLDVFQEQGEVWWGWWRKDHEELPRDVLAAARDRLPLRIGLVNRQTGQFVLARCEDIAFDDSRDRIPTPDAARTPSYYRDAEIPAWLRLTRIDPVDESEWRGELGGIEVPLGDPTLYAVLEEGGGVRLAPGPPDLSQGVESPRSSILHMSDLHFGEHHGFPLTGGGLGPAPMVDTIARHLSEEHVEIGVIVVSGDLITKGRSETFGDAQEMLERLGTALDVSRENVVIVPGNHDLPVDREEEDEPTRDFGHERDFRNFLRSYRGADIQEIESVVSVSTPDDWQLVFVGLNSARLRSKETKEYGYVGPRRKAPLQELHHLNQGRTAAELAESRTINFVVMHHHLLPGQQVTVPEANRPISLTLDAGELVTDFQRENVHVVLHGHQHIPFVGSTARARRIQGDDWDGHASPIYVVGIGSCGASTGRLTNEMRDNTFGIYTPGASGLDVKMHRFNPTKAPETFLQTTIPLG